MKIQCLKQLDHILVIQHLQQLDLPQTTLSLSKWLSRKKQDRVQLGKRKKKLQFIQFDIFDSSHQAKL